jgi:glycosyltransferase involved in cell wall biosynthesis
LTDGKPRVVYYSDGAAFGGADMVFAHMLNTPAMRRFDAVWAYRRNARFDAGVRRWLKARLPLRALFLPDRFEWVRRLQEAGVPAFWVAVFRLLMRPVDYVWILYGTARLACLFRAERPDLVHVNNGGYPGAQGCRAAVLAARLAGARAVVLTVNNIAVRRRLPQDVLEYALDPLIERAADAMVTASRAAQEALRLNRFRRRPVLQIPNGVARPELRRPPEELRREIGAAQDEYLVAMVAFFEPRKGHHVLVDAVRSMRPAVRVVLAGDGPIRREVERRVRQEGVAERFAFLGYRDDAADWLNLCDVLVLPSTGSEDMPLVVLDAMALGKPVVASRFGGIAEEVVDGSTGLLVPPGDAGALAAALDELRDAARRRRLGEAGRRRFEELFSADRMAERYGALYERLLGGRKAAP